MHTGNIKVELLNAIQSAFRRPYEIDLVASSADLKKSLSDFLAVPGTPYDQGLFNFLEWIESQNLLVRFLRAARRTNPGNEALGRMIAKFVGLESSFNALRPLAPDGRSLSFEEAEGLVFRGVTFENVGPWLDFLGKIRHAVCRIEPQPAKVGLAGYGTGFLVAPDVVMTCFHVAAPFWTDPIRAKQVRVRFDYETAVDGIGTGEGQEYALRGEWLAGTEPNSRCSQPWQCIHSSEEHLDFALLRLNKRAAVDSGGGGARSFLTLTARMFHPADPVMILQHPAAEPLKLSFGAVIEMEPHRVRYKVNTQGGSSGSPCLTQDLKVTAIHHYGLGDQNRGVTHEAILSYLGKRDNRKQLKIIELEQYLLS